MCAWVNQFLCNSQSQCPNQVAGPLTTTEIRKQQHWWIKRAQQPTIPKGLSYAKPAREQGGNSRM